MPTDTPETEADAFTGVDVAKVGLIVPTGSYEKYKNHAVWGKFMMESNDEVTDSESSETAIRAAHYEALKATEVFDISGRRQNTLQHGLNLIRRSDGSTRKVMVK